MLDSDSVIRKLYVINSDEKLWEYPKLLPRKNIAEDVGNHVTSGSLKRKLDEGNLQSINVDLHIPISVTLLS